MALARKSMKKVADQCLFSKKSHNYALRNIGKTVLKEVKSFVAKSNLSLFGSHSMKDLREFEWDRLHQEMLETAPTLSSIFFSATKCRKERSNRIGVICLCMAIILKYRSNKMNFVQRILSLVLYANKCSKKVKSISIINQFDFH